MAADALVRFKGDKKHLDKTTRSVKSDLKSIAKVGGAAVLGLTAATGAFAASSVRSFATFDDNMNQSLSIMGDVEDKLKNDMKNAAMEVGSTMRISSSEAAEAYFFLASAGISAENSIGALGITATFAQAGMFDMARATDLLTDAQSALGMVTGDNVQDMENMVRVSDALVKANTLANATVEQFSEALTNGAGAALKMVNKDVEEGLAVLAAFADQGIKGANAGTQFGIVMRDLQTKAIKNKEAFAEAGVAVFDASGNMKNMADIIGDLEGAMAGMSDASAKEFLLGLGFSDKSVKSIQTLLGTSDKIRDYEEALRDAAGTTQEVSDKQAESFAAQMEIIGNRFENFKIRIGERIAPEIIKAFDSLENWWDEHGESLAAKASNWWKDFRRGAGIVSDAWTNKIKPTIQNLWSDFQKGWALLRNGASQFWTWFKIGWQGLGAGIRVIWDWLVRLWGNIWKAIKGIWKFFKGFFNADFRAMWGGLKDFLVGTWNAIKQLTWTSLKLLWKFVTWAIPKAAEAFGKLFGWILSFVAEKWKQFTDNWRGALNNAIQIIWDAGGRAFEAAKNFGGKVLDGIKSGITGAVGFVKDIAKGIGNAIIDFTNRNVIGKVNDALEFDITVFGKTIRIDPPDMPNIPRLARGGVLDSPALIVAGDSPGESEIVSPESKMRQAFRETLEEMGGGSGGPLVGEQHFYGMVDPDAVVNSLSAAARTRRF